MDEVKVVTSLGEAIAATLNLANHYRVLMRLGKRQPSREDAEKWAAAVSAATYLYTLEESSISILDVIIALSKEEEISAAASHNILARLVSGKEGGKKENE